MAFHETKAFKNFAFKLYRIGIALVVISFLLWLNDFYFARLSLTIGASLLFIIFIFAIFDKPVGDPDWTLVYPELIDDKEVQQYLQDKAKTEKEIQSLKEELQKLNTNKREV